MNQSQSQRGNYAFIDSQNLNQSTLSMGWNMDWIKFRNYLKKKYGVSVAYMFIGYIPENQELYASLQKAGYVLVFKPTLQYRDGTVKGNIDVELVMQVMLDYKNYDKAVVVTGDGDFHALINHLYGQGKLEMLLVPNKRHFSNFLTDAARERITFLNNLRSSLAYKKRVHRPAASHNSTPSPADKIAE